MSSQSTLAVAMSCSLLAACTTDDGNGVEVIRAWRAGALEHHEIVLDGAPLTVELVDFDEATVVQVSGPSATELVAVARAESTSFLDNGRWTSVAPASPAASAAELALDGELPAPDDDSSFRLMNVGGFCGFLYRACMHGGGGGCEAEYESCLGNH